MTHHAFPCPALVGRLLLLLGFCLLASPAQIPAATPELDERTRVAVEALYRLEGIDISQNPALQNAVLNLVKATRGTPDFVKLISKFNLAGHTRELLDFAVDNPADETGVQAMSLVLHSPDSALLRQTLLNTNTALAARALQALGNTSSAKAVPVLGAILTNLTTEITLRKQAVRALCRTAEGASALLQSIRKSELPEDLAFTASVEMAALRWSDLREQAAQILPPPRGPDAQPLPPLSELVQRPGNPARGAQVFAREGPNCSTCHRVRGQGTDVGPDLSEIGTKLGKDALFEAILDPSAGISFGFEAHELELASGEEAFGLIVSETESEITIKDTRGIITRHKKDNISARRALTLSIMPSGLQLTMSTQDLVDLVEFLSSLKKK